MLELSALLDPRSIAVFGASEDPDKAGGRVLRYLRQYQYGGAVYPINPGRETVQGQQAYPDLAAVGAPVDTAVIALPATMVPEALQQAVDAGVRYCVVFSSGFAEVSDEGAELEGLLTSIVSDSGQTRLLGPNCVGVISARTGVTMTFMAGVDQDRFELRDEGLAFVTHSGAFGAFVLNLAQGMGIGLGRLISTGNEADLDMVDILEGLVAARDSRAILTYIEGIERGEDFVRVLRHALEAGVPIAAVKVGRSEHGARAAASHTGAMAGEDRVFDGVFRQFGVARAVGVEDLLDIGVGLGFGRPVPGPRTTIVTLSGGAGVLASDLCADANLPLALWDDAWQRELHRAIPAYGATQNPVDLTGALVSDPELLRHVLRTCSAHPDTDVTLLILGNMEAEEDDLCALIGDVYDESDLPLMVAWVGGSGRARRLLHERGIPAFSDVNRAIRAIEAQVRFSARSARRRLKLPEVATDGRVSPEKLSRLEQRLLTESEVKQLLSAYGVRGAQELVVRSAEDAVAAAVRIGYPIALKLALADVAHKAAIGGVRLGLSTEGDVEQAAQELVEIGRRLGHTDVPLIVQEMVSGTWEVLVGSTIDPSFGPVIALGVGGSLSEQINDVVFRVPPIAPEEVSDMIASLRTGVLKPLLEAQNAEALQALAVQVSRIAQFVADAGEQLEELDVNPLLVSDGSATAVDGFARLCGFAESD